MVENLLPVLCFIDLQLVRAVLAAVRRAVAQSPPRTVRLWWGCFCRSTLRRREKQAELEGGVSGLQVGAFPRRSGDTSDEMSKNESK